MFEKLLNIDTQLTLLLNGSESVILDQFALTATATSTWLPLAVLLLYVVIRGNKWQNVLIVILSIALAITLADQLASGVCKPLVARLRPSQDPLLSGVIDIVGDYRGGRYGFFSSHAANTCAVATFLSLLFRNKGLTIALYSWTLLNCWTRVYLGVHYVGDLLVGLLWGTIVGILVYKLAVKCFNKFAPQDFVNIYNRQRSHLLVEGVLLTYLAITIIAFVKA